MKSSEDQNQLPIMEITVCVRLSPSCSNDASEMLKRMAGPDWKDDRFYFMNKIVRIREDAGLNMMTEFLFVLNGGTLYTKPQE